MRQLCNAFFLSISTLLYAVTATAQPAFVNGIVIDGGELDATREPGANGGRFGFFSDLYYDPARAEWWALSDRGLAAGRSLTIRASSA